MNQDMNNNTNNQELEFNKNKREDYEQLMRESSTKTDGYWDKNNPIVKIILFVLFIIIVIGIISLIILIPKTNFYKNIKVHLDFLKVEDVTDIIDNGNLIDHFIFSQRVTFLTDRKSIYDNATFQEKLFGIGYYYNGKKDKQVEMDYFDIYLNHGIIGFIIFFSVYLYILVQTTKIKRKLNFNLYMLNVSMLLILFLSLFTGHIITAPAVSLIVVVIIMMLQINDKKTTKEVYVTIDYFTDKMKKIKTIRKEKKKGNSSPLLVCVLI